MDDSKISDTMLAALRAEGMPEIKAVAALARFWSIVRIQAALNARPEYPAFK